MEREVNERRRGSRRTEKKRQEKPHIKKNQPDFKATRCRIMGDGMLTRLRTWWKKMRPSSSTVPLSSKYEDRNHKTIGEEDTRQVTEKDEIQTRHQRKASPANSTMVENLLTAPA